MNVICGDGKTITLEQRRRGRRFKREKAEAGYMPALRRGI